MLKRGQFIQELFTVWDDLTEEELREVVGTVKRAGRWPKIEVTDKEIRLDYGDAALGILRGQ